MRTKVCRAARHVHICSLEPPEVYLIYDGLIGVSNRRIAADILHGLRAGGEDRLRSFVEAIRRRRWARVWVDFDDYVQYGPGGGEATAEFYFGTFRMLHEPASPKSGIPEHIAIRRDSHWERTSLDGLGEGPETEDPESPGRQDPRPARSSHTDLGPPRRNPEGSATA
ncbi:MAG: hypothetical protein QXG65_04290 [Thermoplasmata archaeon]